MVWMATVSWYCLKLNDKYLFLCFVFDSKSIMYQHALQDFKIHSGKASYEQIVA